MRDQQERSGPYANAPFGGGARTLSAAGTWLIYGSGDYREQGVQPNASYIGTVKEFDCQSAEHMLHDSSGISHLE